MTKAWMMLQARVAIQAGHQLTVFDYNSGSVYGRKYSGPAVAPRIIQFALEYTF
jgi:hypothetical protein